MNGSTERALGMNGSTGRALGAMVWKEWRENGKWALLAALGLILGILINVTETHGAFYYVIKVFEGWWAGFDVSMWAGSLLVAAALPFLQIFPEQRRDQWAFLIHRPASRSTLFWGKAIAGLTLYLAATLVPLIIVAAWAAVPGDLPGPFDLHTFAPALRSVLAGVILYFGALLTALRPARWYGSRAFPVVLATLCAFGVSAGASQLALPLLVAVFAAAAWGAFLSGGDDSRQPLAGKIALRLALYGAFLAICLGGVAAGVAVDQTMHPDFGEATLEEFGVLPPSHIVREVYTRSNWSTRAYTLTRLQDADGRAYPVDMNRPRQDRWLMSAYSLPTPGFGQSAAQFDPWSPIWTYQETERTHLRWYYVAAGRGIEIYSLTSRRLVGRFGPDGYRSVGDAAPTAVQRRARFARGG